MSHDKKFDQIWNFRRRDDDIDSSSDDSKSILRADEPVLKKHKLVSDFILPENDDVGYSQRSHDEGILDQGAIVCVEDKKTNTECNGLKKKRGSVKTKKATRATRAPRGLLKKEASKKTSKQTSQTPVSDDLRIFTKTVIEELRVARETMFEQMREDMRKLATPGPTAQPTRKKGVRKTSQKQPRKRAAVSNKSAEAKKCKKVEEKREYHDQTNETITSDEKEKDAEKSSVKNPTLKAQPDQVASTSYLTLPSLLSDSPATGNDSSLNLERGNLLIGTNGQPNYFSSIQTNEPFRSYAQMGLKDSESFCIGTGFPIPLHRRLDNSFNIPRPVLESSSRDTSNIVGLRINGAAVRLSSGIRALPDHLTPNNFHSFYPN